MKTKPKTRAATVLRSMSRFLASKKSVIDKMAKSCEEAAVFVDKNAALFSTAFVPGWKPIASAPRDGTMFLAYDSKGSKRMLIVNWPDMHGIGCWNKRGNGSWSGAAEMGFIPTHWAPRPPTP